MSQLALFEGPHLPRTAAREALTRGELGEASAQLARLGAATVEAADAARLERIRSALAATGEDAVRAVHRAFASAFGATEPEGFLSDGEWFRVHARQLARALEAEPALPHRGWLGAHFAWAAGDADLARRASRRIVERAPPGPAWIEAARIALDLGEGASACAWIHAACLDSPVDLTGEPAVLERCGVPALDSAPALPRLPAPIEDLFDAARTQGELPGPRARWVTVLGEIDRVLVPAEQVTEADPDAGSPERGADAGHPARAFLAALRAARRSRERDGARAPDRCSDRELRARQRMQRLAPALLARYLRGLRGSLL